MTPSEARRHIRAEPYEESLLLGSTITDSVVEIVVVYPTFTPPRDFRRLLFTGVRHVEVGRGLLRRDPPDLCRYRCSPTDPAHTVQAMICTGGARGTLTMSLGTAGVIEFEFASLEIEQILAHGLQVGPREWRYRDERTNREVDFYDPFSPADR